MLMVRSERLTVESSGMSFQDESGHTSNCGVSDREVTSADSDKRIENPNEVELLRCRPLEIPKLNRVQA